MSTSMLFQRSDGASPPTEMLETDTQPPGTARPPPPRAAWVGPSVPAASASLGAAEIASPEGGSPGDLVVPLTVPAVPANRRPAAAALEDSGRQDSSATLPAPPQQAGEVSGLSDLATRTGRRVPTATAIRPATLARWEVWADSSGDDSNSDLLSPADSLDSGAFPIAAAATSDANTID